MNLDDHLGLVRKGVALACCALAAAVVAQPLLQADFKGIPFLLFGVANGVLFGSLYGRLLWMRLTAARK
jgi:hypothetical protein